MYPSYEKVFVDIGKDYFTKKETPVVQTVYSKKRGFSSCMLVSPVLNVKYGHISTNANLHIAEPDQAIYSLDCNANLEDDKERKNAETVFKWLKTIIQEMKDKAYDLDTFDNHKMQISENQARDQFCDDCYVSVFKKDKHDNHMYNFRKKYLRNDKPNPPLVTLGKRKLNVPKDIEGSRVKVKFSLMMYNMKERFGIKANLIGVEIVELKNN